MDGDHRAQGQVFLGADAIKSLAAGFSGPLASPSEGLAISYKSGSRCAENSGDGGRCHGVPVRGALSLQPFLGSLPDQQIDQRQPLGLVVGFSQQLPIAMEVKTRVLLIHLTPPRMPSQSIPQAANERKNLARRRRIARCYFSPAASRQWLR